MDISGKRLGVLATGVGLMFLLNSANVSAASSLRVSASANRSAPSSLAGQALNGNVYVFATSDSAIKSVQFYLDGAHKITENVAPWDFAGTAGSGTAYPFDTNAVASGSHTITAKVTLTNGATETVSGTFTRGSTTTASTAATADVSAASSLLVSTSANRSAPSSLAGQALSGNIYVFATSDSAIKSVQFYLDGTHKITENQAPWDFAGTSGSGTAYPFDTNAIATGGHTISAKVTLTNGATETVTGTFTRGAPSTTASVSASTGGTVAASTSGKKWHPGHYVIAYEDAGVGNLSKISGDPYFAGIDAWHYWREIETSKGVYNFNEIASEVAAAKAVNKRYFLTMMFKTFATKHAPCVPNDMLSDPVYKGGQSVRYNSDGSVKYCIAKVWVPAVRDRLNALYSALGKRFDAEPYFEGVQTSENSLSGPQYMTNNGDYTLQGYTDGLKSGMAALAAAFPRSQVLSTVNWVKQQLDQLIPYAYSLGIGIGCPDLVPPLPGEGTMESYAYYPSYHGKMPLTVNVEGGVKSKLVSGIFDLNDLYNYAVTNPKGLRVNYIFWTVAKDGGADVVWSFNNKLKPMISGYKGYINQNCPLNMKCQ